MLLCDLPCCLTEMIGITFVLIVPDTAFLTVTAQGSASVLGVTEGCAAVRCAHEVI